MNAVGVVSGGDQELAGEFNADSVKLDQARGCRADHCRDLVTTDRRDPFAECPGGNAAFTARSSCPRREGKLADAGTSWCGLSLIVGPMVKLLFGEASVAPAWIFGVRTVADFQADATNPCYVDVKCHVFGVLNLFRRLQKGAR
ncbi:hypothetical protein LWP59_26425 [Amycolatopsis acidiphila]|nr:hypothetical protein [Amycolatopsis acidiphila]UIJ57666.1 hypothetical protein LWP59_26425 [Amycolatopsis acidiphila]GHG95474.1 hypothetical protein GCM10017788_73920 [Amycolatopsis acidiphila]